MAGGPDESLAALVGAYVDQCAHSRRVVAAHGLDDVAAHPESDHTVRFALHQVLEETARHAGHLDILRELLDGSTGR
jgi:hypothetical protein